MKNLLTLTAHEIKKLKTISKTFGRANRKEARETYNIFKFLTNDANFTEILATTGAIMSEFRLKTTMQSQTPLVLSFDTIEALPENRALTLISEDEKFFFQDENFKIEVKKSPLDVDNFISIERARKNILKSEAREITFDLELLNMLLLSKEKKITIRLEKERALGTPIFEIFNEKMEKLGILCGENPPISN